MGAAVNRMVFPWSPYALGCAQWCQLCDPMDCRPLGSSVPGILQARVLERTATSFSRDLPDPGTEPTSPVPAVQQVDSLPAHHWGSPDIRTWKL